MKLIIVFLLALPLLAYATTDETLLNMIKKQDQIIAELKARVESLEDTDRRRRLLGPAPSPHPKVNCGCNTFPNGTITVGTTTTGTINGVNIASLANAAVTNAGNQNIAGTLTVQRLRVGGGTWTLYVTSSGELYWQNTASGEQFAAALPPSTNTTAKEGSQPPPAKEMAPAPAGNSDRALLSRRDKRPPTTPEASPSFYLSKIPANIKSNSVSISNVIKLMSTEIGSVQKAITANKKRITGLKVYKCKCVNFQPQNGWPGGAITFMPSWCKNCGGHGGFYSWGNNGANFQACSWCMSIPSETEGEEDIVVFDPIGDGSFEANLHKEGLTRAISIEAGGEIPEEYRVKE